MECKCLLVFCWKVELQIECDYSAAESSKVTAQAPAIQVELGFSPHSSANNWTHHACLWIKKDPGSLEIFNSFVAWKLSGQSETGVEGTRRISLSSIQTDRFTSPRPSPFPSRTTVWLILWFVPRIQVNFCPIPFLEGKKVANAALGDNLELAFDLAPSYGKFMLD